MQQAKNEVNVTWL